MIEDKIAQANDRLKKAAVRVTIECKGGKLNLRATLPPKPGSKKTKPFQQRIPLRISASPGGVVLAEKEARKVSALLDCKEFDWAPYLTPKQKPPTLTGEWIEKFKAEVAHTMKPITWQTDYASAFKKPDANKALTYDLLEEAIDATEPDSRTRKRLVNTLGQLAKFAGLEGDFKQKQATYSVKGLEKRDLPTDEKIVAVYNAIKNPAWQWVYGMMATYGLRNHEVFFLDLKDFIAGADAIRVTEGKTGGRQVWPYYPEWIDLFNLRSPIYPDIKGAQHSDYGDRVTCYLRSRAKMPFQPYDLRHAWAVRTISFGLPDSLSAQQMGHSLEVHNRIYQRWITARTHQQEYERLKARTDRPRAPGQEPTEA
jgi:integrase